MISEPRQIRPGLFAIVRRLARTASGTLQNRAELFALEWREEKARLMSLLIWTVAFLFGLVMGVFMLTATLFMFMPPKWRPWAGGAFTVVYVLGAVFAWSALKKQIDQEAFPETIDQLKRDGIWLDSLDKRN